MRLSFTFLCLLAFSLWVLDRDQVTVQRILRLRRTLGARGESFYEPLPMVADAPSRVAPARTKPGQLVREACVVNSFLGDSEMKTVEIRLTAEDYQRWQEVAGECDSVETMVRKAVDAYALRWCGVSIGQKSILANSRPISALEVER